MREHPKLEHRAVEEPQGHLGVLLVLVDVREDERERDGVGQPPRVHEEGLVRGEEGEVAVHEARRDGSHLARVVRDEPLAAEEARVIFHPECLCRGSGIGEGAVVSTCCRHVGYVASRAHLLVESCCRGILLIGHDNPLLAAERQLERAAASARLGARARGFKGRLAFALHVDVLLAGLAEPLL